MQEDGGRIKAAGKMGHMDFLNWVQKKLQEGWQIYSCYEAGASGYWLHRELVKLGVKNLVVVGKKQKTDKRGAGALCDCPRKSCTCRETPWLKTEKPVHLGVPSHDSLE